MDTKMVMKFKQKKKLKREGPKNSIVSIASNTNGPLTHIMLLSSFMLAFGFELEIESCRDTKVEVTK